MANAILLCSGIGRRMAPITGCVKGFLPVRGEKSNIHRIVRILHESCINDIIVAIHPDYLDKLDTIFRDILSDENYFDLNLEYVSIDSYEPGCNNSVTMREVAPFINNTYVIECDQYYDARICKEKIFTQDHQCTTLFTKIRTESDDWSVSTYKNGLVEKINHSNPTCRDYCLSGIIYISGSSKSHLIKNLNNLSNQSYWEDAIDPESMPVYNQKLENYSIEFDDISNLISNNLMTPQDIADLITEDGFAHRVGGMTNSNFQVTYEGTQKILRLPGYGTNQFIKHNRERLVETLIHDSNPDINPISRYYCKDYSVKMTDYLHGYYVFSHIGDLPRVIRRLHEIHQVALPDRNSNEYSVATIDLLEELSQYEDIAGNITLPNYDYVKSIIKSFLAEEQSENLSFVHRDPVPLNIMLNSTDVKFIDWEYSGILNKYWDIAAFCCEYADEYGTPLESIIAKTMKSYPEELDISQIYNWIAVVDFIWSVWSMAKIKLGDDVLAYGLHRYKRCLDILITCSDRR